MKILKTSLYNNKKTNLSLVEGLNVLDDNLGKLKKVSESSERASNDMILQFQIDMEKTEALPLVKHGDEEKYSAYWNDLFELYNDVMKIYSLIIAFYDKTFYGSNYEMYASFIKMEHDEIISLKNSMNKFLSGKVFTKDLLESNSRAFLVFKRELFRLSAEADMLSDNPFHVKILSILKEISDINKNILEKLSGIYRRANNSDEDLYGIIEETEKAFLKNKLIFKSLLNANKF